MRPQQYALIIPACDEAESIRLLLPLIPRGTFDQVIVVDNGSRDRTAAVAREAGAEVVSEPRRGYGRACLAGLAHIHQEISAVAFMDADLADDAEDLQKLAEVFKKGDWDLVIGSRVLVAAERGSLAPVQRFGNWLATRLIRLLWGARFTDLGPLRIARRDVLTRLDVRDGDFGWNVEMQAKAARSGLKVIEVPVRYRRRRFGRSKISGTVWGSARAGLKILWTIYRCWREDPGAENPPLANVQRRS
jgi:glycosyltransferase involved in cell wall biosynthesis